MTILVLLTAAVAAVRGLWSPCGLSMLSALNPVSEAARGHRFWITACWYLAGALAGGALVGAGCAIGAAGFGSLPLPDGVAWALALAAALVALVSDTGVAGWSLPVHPRQVDVRWLTSYRRWIYAGGYGVQIGSGFATYIMSAAVYLLAGLTVLGGDARSAFAAWLVFGAVRGAGILLAAPARDADRLRAVLARVTASAGRSRAAVVAVEVLVAVVAGWSLGGVIGAVGAAGAVGVLFAVAAVARRTTARAAVPGTH